MEIPKILDYADYDNYPGEQHPTTYAELMMYMANQNKILTAITTKLWQPQTSYANNAVVFSPNMPPNSFAIIDDPGKSGSTEPQWNTIAASFTDGTARWKLYRLGTVVMVNGNRANSNGQVEIPEYLGADDIHGGVPGLVPKTFDPNVILTGGGWRNAGDNFVTQVNGLKGDVVIDDYIDQITLRAGELVFNYKNGCTQTVTIPLPKSYITERYVSGTEWYEVYSDGWVRQGGRYGTRGHKPITLLRPFADTNYTVSLTHLGGTDEYSDFVEWVSERTTTTFQIQSSASSCSWMAEGMGAK